ncbi:transposase [Haladaptatus halobius]|uniref:transposase n=1 Tax=Haladaptatus halobius TaxID=2884875 RepID=UPI001D0B5FE7|nr:transposase [Haladaptatus halobius]
MTQRGRRLTDAFVAALELRKCLRGGTDFCTAFSDLRFQIETLEDGYPKWHPASYSFHGMHKLFVYLEVTGDSYRSLTRHPELADVFGLSRIPDESVLSRAWRNRFDDDVRGYFTASAHCLVKEIYNEDLSVPEVRPLEEVKQSSEETFEVSENVTEFSDEKIYRTTRLAREHGFSPFNSGRAQNAIYEDTRLFELQTFIGMVGCGTPQGAARFKICRGKEYGPHGDTHLRTVKQFDPENLIEGFQQATERLLSVIQSESSFRRPVTVAIDITTIRYFGNVEGMPMVSGTKDGEGRAFKFATLSIVGWNIPLILAVEPIRESSSWDQNPPNQIHRVVRRLVRRAQEHVSIEMVLCDRDFDSKVVYQTLSNLDVNYLIPKRIHTAEREAIEMMNEDGQEVAVESATVHTDHGSHAMQLLSVLSTKGEGTAVFATNLSVDSVKAATFCRRYSRRWQIENEYKSMKNDFLAKTSSKDYRVRLFYFVFAVLLHNIWRLTDFLLKASVDSEMDYAPVFTAGECVELVCSALISPD